LGSPLLQGYLKRSCNVMKQLSDEGFTVLELQINGRTSPMITVDYDHRCEFLASDGLAIPVREGEDDFGRWVAYQMNYQDCCVTWEARP
ncbi:hypothetical protein CBG25_04990, partial [Arsenophonus sp. ENCA]|uniref:hypothetical protein n=1 Tax=Arsenophonus sp. ENCA TaxID=1987579 RepID=UPI000BC4B218